MNKKNLIIGGAVITALVLSFYFYKKKRKSRVNIATSMVDPALKSNAPVSIPTNVETRVSIGGMKPTLTAMPSIAPPKPMMNRVRLAGVRPAESYVKAPINIYE